MKDNAFYKVTDNTTGKTMYCKTLHGTIVKILEIEKSKANDCSSLDEYAQEHFFYTWEDYCSCIGKNIVDYCTHNKKKNLILYCVDWKIEELYFTV